MKKKREEPFFINCKDEERCTFTIFICQKCKGDMLCMRDKLDKEGINYVNYNHDNR